MHSLIVKLMSKERSQPGQPAFFQRVSEMNDNKKVQLAPPRRFA
jgi:hypothetical protein